VSQQQRLGLFLKVLKKAGAIQAKVFAEEALSVFDGVVHLVGGQIDEPDGQVGHEGLESQPFPEFLPQLLFNVVH
jgi:hypothetical protein